MPRHFIGGLGGVGKTTLVSAITAANPAFERLHTTSLFMEHLGISPGDYDQLRRLSDEHKREQNNEMLKELLSTPMPSDRHQILDSHYLNIVEGRVTRLIEGTWPQRLGSLALITADVEVIYNRLAVDAPTRDRRLFEPHTTPGQQRDIISRYLDMTTAEFKCVVGVAGRPSIIIDNSGPPEVAANQFLEFNSGSGHGAPIGVNAVEE